MDCEIGTDLAAAITPRLELIKRARVLDRLVADFGEVLIDFEDPSDDGRLGRHRSLEAVVDRLTAEEER